MIGSDHQRVGLAGELPHLAEVIAEQLRRNGFDPADAVNRQVLCLAEVLDAKLRTIFTRGWREI